MALPRIAGDFRKGSPEIFHVARLSGAGPNFPRSRGHPILF